MMLETRMWGANIPYDVLLTNFREMEFAFLFQVGKYHENKEDNGDADKNDDGNN